MPSKVERKKAAYHEAGHVVIAWYYNIRSFGVSIAKNKDTSGTAQIWGLFGKVRKLQTHQLERELDISMAGAAAEEQLTGKKKSGTSWGGADYINAVKIAEQWAEQTGNTFDESYLIDMSIKADGITGCLFSAAFLDEFAAHVRQLMTRPHIWKCVEAVARELQNKTVLTREETTDIISMTWEEMDSDEQGIVMEKQKSDSNKRPWGEWRPE